MERSEKTRLRFSYKGKDYVLEVTAATIKAMERSGVKLSQLGDMPVTAPETLFSWLFLENHPTTTDRTKHEIYKALADAPDGEDAAEADGDWLPEIVTNMYLECIEEIRTSRGGNVAWTVTRS